MSEQDRRKDRACAAMVGIGLMLSAAAFTLLVAWARTGSPSNLAEAGITGAVAVVLMAAALMLGSYTAEPR